MSWSPSTERQSSPNVNTRQKNLHFKGTCMARESLYLESKGLLRAQPPRQSTTEAYKSTPTRVELWEGRNWGDCIDPTSKPHLLHQVSKCQHSCWGHDVLQEATAANYVPFPNGCFCWASLLPLPHCSVSGSWIGLARTHSTCRS